jgi:hypothetical protein
MRAASDQRRIQAEAGGRPLIPMFDLRNHSLTGFSVGYAGSDPQTALVILTDVRGNERA